MATSRHDQQYPDELDSDSNYAHAVAERSIARAALHLGVEGMETQALRVMASVLLDYMDKIGTMISNDVELSGRSSAHVNVYDALNAIEECTCPAASHLATVTYPSSSYPYSYSALSDNKDNHNLSMGVSSHDISGTRGWEGLASFLFGPDWYLIPLEEERDGFPTALSSSSYSANPTSNANTSQLGEKMATTESLDADNNNNNKNNNNSTSPTTSTTTKLEINGVRNDNHGQPTGKTMLQLISTAAKVNNDTATTISTTTMPSSNIGKHVADSIVGGGKECINTVDHLKDRNASFLPPEFKDVDKRWNAPHVGRVDPFPIVPTEENMDNSSSHFYRRRQNHHEITGRTMHSLSFTDLAKEWEACRDSSSAEAAMTTTSTFGHPLQRQKFNKSSGSEGAKRIDGPKKNTHKKLKMMASSSAQEAAQLAEEEAMRQLLHLSNKVCLRKDAFYWGCLRDEDRVAHDTTTATHPILTGRSKTMGDDDKEENKVGTGITAPNNINCTTDSVKPLMRVKFDSSPIMNHHLQYHHEYQDSSSLNQNMTMSSYIVPNFLPPFPSDQAAKMEYERQLSVSTSVVMGKLLSQIPTRQRDKKGRDGRKKDGTPSVEKIGVTRTSDPMYVRQSVIALGKPQSFWLDQKVGYGNDMSEYDALSSGRKDGHTSTTINEIVVSAGSSTSIAASSKKANGEISQIVPLTRSSGSRVCKILEGSMT